MTITETKVPDRAEDILFYHLEGTDLEWAHPCGRRISANDIEAMRNSDQRTPVRMAAKRAIAATMVKSEMKAMPRRGSRAESHMFQRIAAQMDKMTVKPFYESP